MNREAQYEFNALMKDLQQELGGELKVHPSLKGEARVREKAKNQFDGDYSRVIDVLAGTLIFESESEILNAVEKLKAKDNVVWIGDLVYRAGLLGKLADMDARDKASALEIARRHQNNSARKSTSDSFF